MAGNFIDSYVYPTHYAEQAELQKTTGGDVLHLLKGSAKKQANWLGAEMSWAESSGEFPQDLHLFIILSTRFYHQFTNWNCHHFWYVPFFLGHTERLCSVDQDFGTSPVWWSSFDTCHFGGELDPYPCPSDPGVHCMTPKLEKHAGFMSYSKIQCFCSWSCLGILSVDSATIDARHEYVWIVS